MPNKKQKLRPDKSGNESLYRQAELARDDADHEARSIPVILATENPVKTYDASRMEVVDEVLSIEGMDIPRQLPLVDSHDDSSVRNVIGSIRDLEKHNDELRGRMFFAADEDSQRAFEKYADGHLTDVSIRARREKVRYDGNTRIVVRSRAMEGSAVVAGADPDSKVIGSALRAYLSPDEMREEAVMEKLRALAVARGFNADGTDKELLEFVERSLTSEPGDANTGREDLAELVDAVRALREQQPTPGNDDANDDDATSINDALRAERKRVADISDLCRTHNVQDDERQKFVADGTSVDDVARSILATLGTKDSALGVGDGDVRGGQSSREKWYEAVRSAFVQRAVDASGINPDGLIRRAEKLQDDYGEKWRDRDALVRSRELSEDLNRPSAGYAEYRYVGLPELARMFLEQAGERVTGLPKTEICARAMKMDRFVQRAADGPAYNTTGSFSHLMLDAANKTLLAAYDEAAVTYPMWVRQAPSASDFKDLHRVRFGELPDPEVVPEGNDYPDKQPGDNRESYGVEKHGEIFSITLEAVVNDDLNAISRIPQMQGNAMRRKINRTCYAILTANDALSDNVALFHASSHGANLDSNALAVSALDTGYNVMMTQAGLNSTTILNIMPRYLIVPAALSATALQIINSTADPTAGGTSAGNSNTANIYGPGGPRRLVPVVDGQLDGNSTTGWYLAADSSQVDTVELTFLQGEEAPALSREEGFVNDTIKYKIRQTFAAKAIDYRGLYQGNS